ncbi:hypothetical protein SELMODRAFT_404265 [Selaginella moellendorffii]|uniref:Uncharacterized protein n=1 Tax=Selaginella moellendorffii TaxID=88036 RepID=D8QUT1_SELML|nr:hypothetical protein SELMODRAFT_404265 [Selaginella moellendorffii]
MDASPMGLMDRSSYCGCLPHLFFEIFGCDLGKHCGILGMVLKAWHQEVEPSSRNLHCLLETQARFRRLWVKEPVRFSLATLDGRVTNSSCYLDSEGLQSAHNMNDSIPHIAWSLVSIHEKREYPLSQWKKCVVHLINQKIRSGNPLGSRVLAASPDPANTKSVKPVGVENEFLVHTWDKDDFEELLGVWRLESKEMWEEADRLLEEAGNSNKCRWSNKASVLRNEADGLDARINAAGFFYDWYSGIPRLLRQAAVCDLSEQAWERKIRASVMYYCTDLPKVYWALHSRDDIACLLLHFKQPLADNARFLLDFAPSKVKDLFTETLTCSRKT